MFGWRETLIVAIVAGILIITVVILLIRRCFFTGKKITVSNHHHHQDTRTNSIQTESIIKKRPNYQLFGRGLSTKSIFNWSDHPALIRDAVENGWSRFAFTTYAPYPTMKSSLFSSLRVTGDNYTQNREIHNEVEESWEIGMDSVDFMQKLHFKINSRIIHSNSSVAQSTIRMGLPLPGPPVVDSFPQEAYFEIMVVNTSEENGRKSDGDGEKAKLLFKQNNSSSVVASRINGGEGFFHVSSSRGSHLLEELKIGRRGDDGPGPGSGPGPGVKMSIGLTVGGYVTNRIPGTYPGSIGFNSDGSVFLAGMKLVFESEKEDWAKTGKVIGCGFDPKKKKVYFTVNSELIHVIHCKSEDFGMPLYPILATNIDITILINLGQSRFSYSPSNAHRTPNPCFIGPLANANATPPALGHEDSQELFSMGRIDADWLCHSSTVRSTVSNGSDFFILNTRSNHNKVGEYEEENESEFFEIVLDST
ncbi:unnamed protein product [Amaranthus hypochondriacus]